MYLIVVSNPEKAKEILKTNREINVGDKIKGDLIMIKKIASNNKDIFKIGPENVEEKKDIIPEKNKKLNKSKKFKSKGR